MFSVISMVLSLQVLLSPSMASSFAPTRSCSALVRPKIAVSIAGLRGGSNSETPPPLPSSETFGSNSETPPPLPNSDMFAPMSDSLDPVRNLIENTRTETTSLASQSATEEPVKFNQLGPNASPPGFLRLKFPHFPWHLLPVGLTYLRCLAIPVLIGVFYMPGQNVATSGLFAMAAATDFLDGYLARKWDVSSSFGAFLDPVVRMILCCSVLSFLSTYSSFDFSRLTSLW
jgi:CDP-alcohol phosphatidyltransferase